MNDHDSFTFLAVVAKTRSFSFSLAIHHRGSRLVNIYTASHSILFFLYSRLRWGVTQTKAAKTVSLLFLSIHGCSTELYVKYKTKEKSC